MDFQMPRRLDKFLADARVGSRNHIEALAGQGVLTRNGETTSDLHRLVDPQHDVIEVLGQRATLSAPTLYAMLHKPPGYVTTLSDPNGRRCVAALVPEAWRGRVGVVGRLDKPTTGALLFTDDGNLCTLLTLATTHVWKRYVLTVVGEPQPDDPRLAELRAGVLLSQTMTVPCRCGIVPGSGRPGRGETRLSEVWVEIREGRFHQVRRMANQVRLKLTHLHRAAVGPLALGDLAEGQWRSLSGEEVEALYAAAGGRDAARAAVLQTLARRLNDGELDEREVSLVKRYFAAVDVFEAGGSALR